ncbi:WD repeat and SOF domain-containing protein [Spraguea lophii 42_110]|uniref:WD repeat and SOF domain-containing protein n=1 Tax=Spraguea lophii (strain 42_110) TaxID=1358809 RepID=S7XGU5_SPRLO|nr:WD repeat and SOF domain-containing protein [Spraguea lophii 42_110]
MKIPVIAHNYKQTSKQRKNDISVKSYIKSSSYFPLYEEREYIRSLNSTKIERLLSKPFVYSLPGHREGVNQLKMFDDVILTSSYDGEIIKWDLKNREIVKKYGKYQNAKIEILDEKNIFISDGKVVNLLEDEVKFSYEVEDYVRNIYYNENLMVCGYNNLLVFDKERMHYKNKFKGEYGFCVKENNLVVCGDGSHVILFDERIEKEINRVKVGLCPNDIKINNEFYKLLVANEDKNVYEVDMRNFKIKNYYGHTNSVLSVDYHPNKKDFISGSMDMSIRISGGKDIYYNNRMLEVNVVKYDSSGEYIISCSNDTSIRVWRSKADKKAVMSRREKNTMIYNEQLKEKYKDVKEIRRIRNHRFLPKKLKNSIKELNKEREAKKRKEEKRKNTENK